MMKFRFIATLTLLLLSHACFAQKDIVVADFEGDTYGDWKVTGTAFGAGPAHGTLPNQMQVSGFMGRGLVNSFVGGDDSTGRLTSPEVLLERKYINFLIGGGAFDGKTCMNLLLNGKTVRTATGPNSEHLDWRTWDVSDLIGKRVVFEIVDEAKGGWGHINIDQITQSNNRFERFVYLDPLYHETYRPQYHFTAKMGWINDPNGLVYYAGEYHMFFQHNPFGTQWGNMTWGHAVSTDMVHWKQLENAIKPDNLGTIFSGSAVVDENNTSGLATGNEKPLICIYTAAGGTNDASKGKRFTQCLAFSNDKGRTWQKYSGNPIIQNVKGENRDPKVVWHAPTNSWIMALYLDGNDYALFRSKDLKVWQQIQTLNLPNCSECPDFFQIPVVGERDAIWVFTAANGQYLTGKFDGKAFTPDQKSPLTVEYGANSYAVQSFSNLPGGNGRRVQISWMNGGAYPYMPFNQQMSVPCELTVRRTPEGLRMFKYPIAELSGLYGQKSTTTNVQITSTEMAPTSLTSDEMDVKATIHLKNASKISIVIKGQEIRYDVATGNLSALGRSCHMQPVNGQITLRILLDRTSLEVFGNDGQVALSSCFLPIGLSNAPTISAEGGEASLISWFSATLNGSWR